MPRKVAIYVCQQYGDMSLSAIMKSFSLSHVGSVSPAIRDDKNGLDDDKLASKINEITRKLGVMK